MSYGQYFSPSPWEREKMKNKLKRWLLIIFCIVGAGWILYSSGTQVTSYVAGIAQGIPDKIHGVINYQAQLKQSRDRVRSMTWEEYRNYRYSELQYESNIWDVVVDWYKKAKDRNLIG